MYPLIMQLTLVGLGVVAAYIVWRTPCGCGCSGGGTTCPPKSKAEQFQEPASFSEPNAPEWFSKYKSLVKKSAKAATRGDARASKKMARKAVKLMHESTAMIRP
jgi:hypothetical protein